jgi:hypothetical protein
MKTYRISFTLHGSSETSYVTTGVGERQITRKLKTIGATVTGFEEHVGPGHNLQNFVTYVETLAAA